MGCSHCCTDAMPRLVEVPGAASAGRSPQTCIVLCPARRLLAPWMRSRALRSEARGPCKPGTLRCAGKPRLACDPHLGCGPPTCHGALLPQVAWRAGGPVCAAKRDGVKRKTKPPTERATTSTPAWRAGGPVQPNGTGQNEKQQPRQIPKVANSTWHGAPSRGSGRLC